MTDKCITPHELCIPYTSGKSDGSRNIAGWNDIVAAHKEASIFWHNIWNHCGSPRNVVIAVVMRCARAKYHSVVKTVTIP
ncbi:hypothetical protein LSH36_644g01105 [Paralvinella palmiformis]|uniref:Uncharacterized protein n=1 Tax=Paralvinella palmiformis TaxID=53620 RepID=A0AAD9MVT0_9ANNE|nr:hypothetical protein LSH36_644g01105 [Paralvinella palmiformis]